MENRNIIIILVAVIVVLAVVAGVMFMQSGHTKESTKLKIIRSASKIRRVKLLLMKRSKQTPKARQSLI